MNRPRSQRPMAGVFAIAFTVALSGCNGAGSTLNPPNQAAQVRARAKELIYVGSSAAGTIDVFEVVEKQYRRTAQILDDNGPEGLHVDPAGNLYVADQGIGSEGPGQGDIAVYPPGASQPTRVIVPGYNVSDVLAAPDGHLFASNFGPVGKFGPGSVSVYGRRSAPLRTMRIRGSFQALSIARDPASTDVFASYSEGSAGRIVRFADARPPAIDLGVSFGPPWGMAEDSAGSLLVADGNGPIHIFSQQGKTLGSISVPGIPYRLSFNADRSLLYVTTFKNFDVEIFTYPAGKMVATIHAPEWSKSAWPDGVAVWPPAP